jgi:hypothetical protein
MITLKIFDRKWKVRVLDNDAFTKIHGNDAAGLTIFANKEIVINASDFTLETVKHELWHAYYASLCVSSANLDPAQVEEVSAELHAVYTDNMNTHAAYIYKQLAHKAEL